ncbi:pyruvate dehydrogenase E2 component (dihydrolipoamide acetyltransferase) [Kitasatospora sp. SolWspMP-SS2h]|uniref:dihydrolipoamide acetyltransferase family protein n=1 Tax=Kitasatospora sp. SolWspMP-SS2h TaxID=1305729 RepID=UPI000DBA330F|nr:dihydrolipoamide acetyltransferase family protein [Kitasatospora sp. SolWspMP-SS2h]RAJ38594.1 pyruvate dehydrogenase E2 component (dihydrolipoamide acetyltransferase) [Kitasatospora sp. SolWspMP-SS2h]
MTKTTQRFREFAMPDVGEGLAEAEILKWYVRVGDAVVDGQPVCEVETAKAAVELPIPFTGVVSELRHPEGSTVDVGAVIILVDTAPADAAPAADAPAADAPAPARQPVLVGYGVAPSGTARRRPQTGRPQAERPQAERRPAGGAPAGTARPERPRAKPPVRKLAKDLGIDLRTVPPTGVHGTVSREDVRAAAEAAVTAAATAVTTAVEAAPAAPTAQVVQAAPAAPAQAVPAARTQAVPAAPGDRRVPVTGARLAAARAAVASAFTAPHVTEFATVDVTRTVKLADRMRRDPELAGLRVTPLLLVVRALLTAVRRHPEINAAWDEERQEIVHRRAVNLGLVLGSPDGRVVPNVKDAQARTLPELAGALEELAGAAREGRTDPADLLGGTVTVTDLGAFGVDTGTPILSPGESAALAVGAIRLRPRVHKGEVVPRQVVTLALSFDHRLVDGELGSRVLADVAAVLEHPKRLLTWG